jgi:hypothetical protein
MEAYYGLIRRLVKAFGTVGLDYMFTGALAASFYGLPRTTTDVDLVVRVSDKTARSKLVNALAGAGMRVDEEEVDRALASGYRIATFADRKTAYSVDVILSNKKLKKRTGTVAGVQTFFQTPEDLISAKLRMIKATVSTERALKDKMDVRAILKFTTVDIEAIKKKAEKDATQSILETLTAEEND